MLHSFLVFTLTLVLAGESCKKSATRINTSFSGSWKLTEQLHDPGDGSGTWRPATSGYARFNADSTMESDVVYIAGFNRYSVDNEKVIFTISGTSTRYTYRYKLEGKMLEIYPNCFEKCGLRFRKE